MSSAAGPGHGGRAGDGARGPWSLTARMGRRFAATTSAILALYALGSAYFVFAAMRHERIDVLRHEAAELALSLSQSDGSPEAIRAAVEHIAKVAVEPDCAFRVRRTGGELLFESGPPRLLAAIREPLLAPRTGTPDILGPEVMASPHAVQGHDLRVEAIVDVQDLMDKLERYLGSAAVVFLLAVALAGLSGWLTARAGLSALRDVVAQAARVVVPGEGCRIDVSGAPREIREVAEALNLMIGRIDEGLGRMRAFTAGLAHELRSPIQNLVGETEVVLLSDRPAEEYRDLLRSNLEDLSELSDAVDNLVAFCRTSEPEAPAARREPFDLSQQARLRLERERRSAARSGVTLALETAGDTRVVADREACLRVLRNLVSNAIAWSPAGGTVSVSLRGETDEVVLAVEDEGPGVPPDLGEAIFEPFVTRPPAGRRAGCGLGLAICRWVLAAHGGRIGYRNLPAGGARFEAHWRRTPVPGAAAGLPALLATPDPRRVA